MYNKYFRSQIVQPSLNNFRNLGNIEIMFSYKIICIFFHRFLKRTKFFVIIFCNARKINYKYRICRCNVTFVFFRYLKKLRKQRNIKFLISKIKSYRNNKNNNNEKTKQNKTTTTKKNTFSV